MDVIWDPRDEMEMGMEMEMEMKLVTWTEEVVLSLAPYRASSPESMKSRRQDSLYFPAFHSRSKSPGPIQALESIQGRKAVPRTNL